jgi:hypothetical protein
MSESFTCKVQVHGPATQVNCEPDPPEGVERPKAAAGAARTSTSPKPKIGPPPPRPAVAKLVKQAEAAHPAAKKSVPSTAGNFSIGQTALKCASELDSLAIFVLAARSAKVPTAALVLAGLKATHDVTKCAAREYDAAAQRASDQRAALGCESHGGAPIGTVNEGDHHALLCSVPRPKEAKR